MELREAGQQEAEHGYNDEDHSYHNVTAKLIVVEILFAVLISVREKFNGLYEVKHHRQDDEVDRAIDPEEEQ